MEIFYLYNLSSFIQMPFHTEIQNSTELKSILEQNNNWIILKFTASWCRPCKLIEPVVEPWIQKLSENNVDIYILDIDENFEIYGYLKTKKRLNGVPALLAYKKGNTSIIPDLYTAGSNLQQLNDFFLNVV